MFFDGDIAAEFFQEKQRCYEGPSNFQIWEFGYDYLVPEETWRILSFCPQRHKGLACGHSISKLGSEIRWCSVRTFEVRKLCHVVLCVVWTPFVLLIQKLLN